MAIRRVVIAGLAPLSAAALAACSSVACTLMGCDSSVDVDLSELATAYGPHPVSVTLCVDDDCHQGTVNLATRPHFGSRSPTVKIDQSSPRIHVRVEGEGRLLLDATTTAHLARFAPNGEECGPVCYTGGVVVRQGRLSPA